MVTTSVTAETLRIMRSQPISDLHFCSQGHRDEGHHRSAFFQSFQEPLPFELRHLRANP